MDRVGEEEMEQWTRGEVTLGGGGSHRRRFSIHRRISAVGRKRDIRLWNSMLEIPEEGPAQAS